MGHPHQVTYKSGHKMLFNEIEKGLLYIKWKESDYNVVYTE